MKMCGGELAEMFKDLSQHEDQSLGLWYPHKCWGQMTTSLQFQHLGGKMPRASRPARPKQRTPGSMRNLTSINSREWLRQIANTNIWSPQACTHTHMHKAPTQLCTYTCELTYKQRCILHTEISVQNKNKTNGHQFWVHT